MDGRRAKLLAVFAAQLDALKTAGVLDFGEGVDTYQFRGSRSDRGRQESRIIDVGSGGRQSG